MAPPDSVSPGKLNLSWLRSESEGDVATDGQRCDVAGFDHGGKGHT